MAFGGDQSQLAKWGQSIIDSDLRSQSNLDHRTHPKSKSGSGTLPQKTLVRWRQHKTINSRRRMNKLAFYFYMSANYAHYYQLYKCAYGMGTERLAWTVWRYQDGAERNENVTAFFSCYCTVQLTWKVNATCVFPAGYTQGTCRSTTRFTRVTIVEPVATRNTPHTQGKSTPVQPTEAFVL